MRNDWNDVWCKVVFSECPSLGFFKCKCFFIELQDVCKELLFFRLLNFPYSVSYSNLYGQPTYGLLRSALSHVLTFVCGLRLDSVP